MQASKSLLATLIFTLLSYKSIFILGNAKRFRLAGEQQNIALLVCFAPITLPGVGNLNFLAGDFPVFILVHADMAQPVFIVMIRIVGAVMHTAALGTEEIGFQFHFGREALVFGLQAKAEIVTSQTHELGQHIVADNLHLHQGCSQCFLMVKPVNYSTFKRKIERALSHCVGKKGEDIILNLRDGVTYRTSPSRIKYIEIQGHSIIIHSTEGNLESYGSLKQLEADLDSKEFVRCHRSFLVNLSYVRAIHGLTVLVGDEELPVAKLKRTEFMQALNKYLGGGN